MSLLIGAVDADQQPRRSSAADAPGNPAAARAGDLRRRAAVLIRSGPSFLLPSQSPIKLGGQWGRSALFAKGPELYSIAQPTRPFASPAATGETHVSERGRCHRRSTQYNRPKFFGRGVERIEDRALITGSGHFVDDIRLPGTLHAAFVRSAHAHARIRGIRRLRRACASRRPSGVDLRGPAASPPEAAHPSRA